MLKGKTHEKETHGSNNDIDRNSSPHRVKGPNLFERAKEEVEALVETINSKMEHSDQHRKKEEKEGKATGSRKDSIEDAAPSWAKTHKNETHGQSNDIDDDTPVEKVKGPNMFERAKEEIEAIVEAIHPKK